MKAHYQKLTISIQFLLWLQLLNFVEKNKETLGNAERSAKQSIDDAKNNLNWLKQNYGKVIDWLRRFY